MKIIISKTQLRYLTEQNVLYTSEKIDEFNIIITKNLEKGRQLFSKYFNQILSVTIDDVINNSEHYDALMSNIKQASDFFEKEYDDYYKIVERYDNIEYPPNVSNLDQLVSELDHLHLDFYNLHDALDNIMDATKELINLKR